MIEKELMLLNIASILFSAAMTANFLPLINKRKTKNNLRSI